MHKHVLDSINTTKTITGLTVGCSRFWPVKRADDDKTEAFALFTVDYDVTGLRVGG